MHSKARVLYISIIGMGEPLGKSQVLEYLKALSKDFDICLHSFEKDTSEEITASLQHEMLEHNIHWSHQAYSNRFGVLSTVFQITSAFFHLLKLVKDRDIQVIHARSLIPVIIALLLKLLTGVKVIFDIRGFQSDEKAEIGRIKVGGLLYRCLKYMEKLSYQYADSIVSLTHEAKSIIAELTDKQKIVVIPTCANATVFKITDQPGLKQRYGYQDKDRVIIHVGTVSNWYDFDAELKLVQEMMLLDSNIKFLILNKGEHDFIGKKLKQYEIEQRKVRVVESDFYEVYKYLNIAEASIFIIKPTFSKKASAPTKFAENLCCQLFSITNSDIGDMDYFISQFPDVGYSFPLDRIESDSQGLSEDILTRLENSKKDSNQYKSLYEKYFSNTMAVKKYSEIYSQLSQV